MHGTRRLSRRQILVGIGGVAAAGLLAACGASPAAPTATTAGPASAAPIAPPRASASGAATSPAASAGGSAAAAPASASASAAPSAAIKRGGQLRILQLNDFQGMDPLYSVERIRACYDWLLGWRPNAQGQFTVVPQLAKSWEVKDNAIVFTLQEGVKFHDGSDLTAEVVAWNIKRMVQSPTSRAANALSSLNQDNPAQALDPLTVQVNLIRTSASVLTTLSDATASTGIVSKKAVDDNGEDYLKTRAVGTGPFKFVSYTSGDRMVATRNENYWKMGADGKALPYVDGVTYRVIIEMSTQFNEMRAGTSDFLSNLPGNNVEAAKQIPTLRYVESVFTGFKKQMAFNSRRPPFQNNLKLRQAFHHAIDRDVLVRALDPVLGMVLPYDFVPGSVGYDTSVPYYEFNLDKANTLIKESGVQLPLTVALTVHNREGDQQQAQLIQAMLDKIGVKMTFDTVERTAWNTKVRVENNFEFTTRQGGPSVDDAINLLDAWDENKGYSREPMPELMAVLNQVDQTYDDAERHKLFVQAQKMMHESAWFNYMWYQKGNYLHHQRVQGFPTVWGSLREEEWWLSE
jgi:ABC-type transport system substrate-binding protein